MSLGKILLSQGPEQKETEGSCMISLVWPKEVAHQPHHRTLVILFCGLIIVSASNSLAPTSVPVLAVEFLSSVYCYFF